jgi:ATP-binding cassette, subfamily C (CFTR/MRP), member 1
MDLWTSLQRVHLIEENVPLDSGETKHSRFTLDDNVSDEGSNFSLGQRQLLAMARTLIRKARIIIMDEATSSVDFETDIKIQHTIKQEFKDATLLVDTQTT